MDVFKLRYQRWIDSPRTYRNLCHGKSHSIDSHIHELRFIKFSIQHNSYLLLCFIIKNIIDWIWNTAYNSLITVTIILITNRLKLSAIICHRRDFDVNIILSMTWHDVYDVLFFFEFWFVAAGKDSSFGFCEIFFSHIHIDWTTRILSKHIPRDHMD